MENYSEGFCESDQKLLQFAFFKSRHALMISAIRYDLVHATTFFSEAISTGKLDQSLST